MGKHKDVNLQAGDKINLYDKSRDKNHVFHVFEEPDGDRSWYSIQDKFQVIMAKSIITK